MNIYNNARKALYGEKSFRSNMKNKKTPRIKVSTALDYQKLCVVCLLMLTSFSRRFDPVFFTIRVLTMRNPLSRHMSPQSCRHSLPTAVDRHMSCHHLSDHRSPMMSHHSLRLPMSDRRHNRHRAGARMSGLGSDGLGQ
jgi:hypothetical protein